MAEYINVEKPFLEKLRALNWRIIDQGSFGIPQDPAKSLRTSFKEVTLKQEFKKAVKKINVVNGIEWLTDKQLEDLYNETIAAERANLSLLEANKQVFEKLIGVTKTTVAKNEVTGEENPLVKLIDFKHWDNNEFLAINQFRIVTPGGPREGIIPDIVLFVNGLPFSVVECKDVDVADPISSSVEQLMRYANTRGDDFGFTDGEERLFHYNLFSVATHGEEARAGSISGDFEYYLNWKDIFPEVYKNIDLLNYAAEETARYENNGLQNDPRVRQEVLIQGLLNKEILLDVLQHFTLFMEIKEGVEVKIVCRYQQYRAVGKIIDRLRNETTGKTRSGVVWHTQGSGKSLTMVFFVRKLRSQNDLKDYKVIMMVDRKDLEKQLSATARLTNEFKEANIVSSRKDLKPKLSGNASDLSMVMVHKFVQEELKHSKALMKAFVEEGKVPEFKPFDVVNTSERIVILIDEAHRTQGGDMGDNLFTAFPKAAKIAFTGTPLLTDRHKQKTHERFGGTGEFIDTYKIRESVDDRATLDIIYIGKTTNDNIKSKEAFDAEFEDVFKKQSKEEREEIQKRYGTMRAYLESMDRLRKIAKNIVNHYVNDILPNGFKAMVVGSSILAAARYQYLIDEALKERVEIEKAKLNPDIDLIEKINFIKIGTIVTKQDNNEQAFISAARKNAKELKAVDNFKKDFDYSTDEEGNYLKPETGVAFLCVCDKLLTGFDAPIAQVMYLDKSIREHDLLQAIARVNRTKKDKSHGILVDYYGVSNHLKDALNIWGAEDEEDIKELLEYFRDINKEIPVLEARYNRMLQLFTDKGLTDFKKFAEQSMSDKEAEFQLAEDCIELAESIPFRAQFDTYIKAFFDSLDLLFNSEAARKYYIPAKRFGYLLVRIKNRYKDPSMDLKWAKPKVRKMIDAHLETLGIDSRVAPVSLLSKDFAKEVKKLEGNSKSKASEMEHAIRRHIKVNINKDPALYKRFLKRMEEIIERYQGNWDAIVAEFDQVREDLAKGRKGDYEEEGLDEQQLPFYDFIIFSSFKDEVISGAEKEALKALTIELVSLLQDAINKPNFWKGRAAEIRKLQGEIDDIIDFSGIDEVSKMHSKLSVEIMNLAKRRHQELTK
ncbi:type I restriction endonuclease subunit R [Bizionia argentinensis JUB59]|uniref:Type I restriction enzyme endonuclease subunit n=1 Tax=Bizionia argentinensis JUB59 TaxID=1046627 RepID=G2ED25_9FLAO|nr:HsdR family type I site-specific deoxyribonuclease [Bizionia argentinensis]EGV43643.1 type I restriction endonuclease subunit R [Bizionia argentinensis JUB59]